MTRAPMKGNHSNDGVRARARAIGRELRRHFEDTIQEPVPIEWIEILHKIDAKIERAKRR